MMIASNTTSVEGEDRIGYLTWLQVKPVTICLTSENGLLAWLMVQRGEQLLQLSSVVTQRKAHIKDSALGIKVAAVIDHVKSIRSIKAMAWAGYF